MRAWIAAICMFAGLSTASCVSPATTDLQTLSSGNYVLEKSHASLIFSVQHFGLSWYTVRFNSFDAKLNFDPAAPEKSSVEAVIDATSIDANHPEKGEEWDQEIANDNRFLKAETFPQIIFKSTNIEVSGQTTGVVTGDLTLLGETHPISMNVTFNGSNSFPWAPQQRILGFSANGKFNRSDFGMTSLLPDVVSDEVRFQIEVEFVEE